MNVIAATTLRNNLSDTLNEVIEKKYLLVARGKKISHALVDLDFFEDLLALKNKKYLASIKQARDDYKSGNIFSHTDVFGNL